MAEDDAPSQVIAFSGNTMVYESVKRFSIKALNELMRVLMDNVDDALFDFVKKAETDGQRNLYFEAMRDLRLKRKQLEADFDRGIKDRFDALISNQKARDKGAEKLELSLVDQSEVEDKLAIDNMIARALPQFEDDLYAVDERLKVVLHRRQLAKNANPLNPQAICESFHAASSKLDMDMQAKLIFYKLFEKFVLAHLDDFYRELNDFFVQKGVLPEFQAAEERMRQTTRFMADLRHKGKDKTDEFSAGETVSRPASEKPAVADEGSVLNVLRKALGLPLSGASSGSGSGASVGAAVDGGQAAGAAGPAASGASGVAGGAGAVVSALTGLQAAAVNYQPLMSVAPAQMQAAMTTQLADFHAANPTSQSERQAIDMISMLFDFFFDDHALPDPVKVLIGRLQIPILKVALLDEEFFNSRKHPARRLLDAISRAALGWSKDLADQQALIDKLEALVERVLQEFTDDVSIFEQAVDELNAFVETEGARSDEAEADLQAQEAQREQRMIEAEKQVDAFLDSLEYDRQFSLGVIDFLRGIWRQVLVTTLVSEGEDSAYWRNLKRITSTLVWTLVPRRSEKGRLKLLKTLPHLLKALSNGMQLIHVEQVAQEQVFQVLVHEHAEVVKQTARNIAAQARQQVADVSSEAGEQVDADAGSAEQQAMRSDDPVNEVQQQAVGDVIHNLEEFTESIVSGNIRIDEEIVMDSSALEASFERQPDGGQDDFVEQARALELGSWVEFDDEQGGSTHARLSWKSNVTGKYIFSDRSGHKVRNLTVYGYAAEMRAGRARAIKELSFFDRAINSLMSGIRH